MQVKDAGRFDEHEQTGLRRQVAPEQGKEFAPTGCAHRQVLFQEESLRAAAQGDTHFLFCGIETEVVIYFH